MIEEDAADAKHSISFAIVAGQIEAGDFADAIRRARVKGSSFPLRRLANFAKHFRGAGEIKTAARPDLAQGRQHIVGAVDVGIHRGEAIGEAFVHKTLRGQVITLVKLVAADDAENRRVTPMLAACR